MAWGKEAKTTVMILSNKTPPRPISNITFAKLIAVVDVFNLFLYVRIYWKFYPENERIRTFTT